MFADIAALERPWLSAEAAEAALSDRHQGDHEHDLRRAPRRERASSPSPGRRARPAAARGRRARARRQRSTTGTSAPSASPAPSASSRTRTSRSARAGWSSPTTTRCAKRARLLRSHGMTSLTWDRHRGHASGYDVVELGFNYRIDEPRAALATARAGAAGRRQRLARGGRRATASGSPASTASPATMPAAPAASAPTICSRSSWTRHRPRRRARELAEARRPDEPSLPAGAPLQRLRRRDAELPLTDAYSARAITLPLFPRSARNSSSSWSRRSPRPGEGRPGRGGPDPAGASARTRAAPFRHVRRPRAGARRRRATRWRSAARSPTATERARRPGHPRGDGRARYRCARTCASLRGGDRRLARLRARTWCTRTAPRERVYARAGARGPPAVPAGHTPHGYPFAALLRLGGPARAATAGSSASLSRLWRRAWSASARPSASSPARSGRASRTRVVLQRDPRCPRAASRSPRSRACALRGRPIVSTRPRAAARQGHRNPDRGLARGRRRAIRAAVLAIAGDGPERPRSKQLAARSGTGYSVQAARPPQPRAPSSPSPTCSHSRPGPSLCPTPSSRRWPSACRSRRRPSGGTGEAIPDGISRSPGSRP